MKVKVSSSDILTEDLGYCIDASCIRYLAIRASLAAEPVVEEASAWGLYTEVQNQLHQLACFILSAAHCQDASLRNR
jgi:hypothetical protein